VLGRHFFLIIDNETLRRTHERRVVEGTRSLRQPTQISRLRRRRSSGVNQNDQITFVEPAATDVSGLPGRLHRSLCA
jgi:hypothetical protein